MIGKENGLVLLKNLNNMNTLYLIVGIVGSGKSTYVKKLSTSLQASVICPDDIRLELTGDMADQSLNHLIFSKYVPQRIKECLAKGDVIYDATNYNRKNRKDVCTLARSLGAKVVAHIMRTPFEECYKRNAGRTERIVPEFVLDRMVAGYEEPDVNIEKIDEIVNVPLN